MFKPTPPGFNKEAAKAAEASSMGVQELSGDEHMMKIQTRLSKLEATRLANDMRSATTGADGAMLISTQSYHLVAYKSVFEGAALVAFLVANLGLAKEDAVAAGQSLLDHRLAHHVTNEHPFKDGHFYYRFYADESVAVQLEAQETDAILRTGSLLSGMLEIKSSTWYGAEKWNKQFCVLERAGQHGDDSTPSALRVYNRYSASAPSRRLRVTDCACSMQECTECRSGMYCFVLRADVEDSGSSGKRHSHIISLCAANSKQQMAWLGALTELGVEMEKENFVLPPGTTALHQLSARRILAPAGEESPLDEFKGQVSLVVNVATE